jgi:hypothetical protein
MSFLPGKTKRGTEPGHKVLVINLKSPNYILINPYTERGVMGIGGGGIVYSHYTSYSYL